MTAEPKEPTDAEKNQKLAEFAGFRVETWKSGTKAYYTPVDCDITPNGNYEIKPYWRGFLAKAIVEELRKEALEK